HRGGERVAEKEGLLPFKLIEDESGEALTSYGGLPLVVETCEALGLARLVKQHVRIKQRRCGYSESQYVQSVIAMMAAGGDCLEDIERLRSDAGLKLLVGEMPSAEAVRFFLYGFHDEKLLEARPEQGAFIATETEPLAGLWEVNREVVLKASRKEEPKQATIDQDATVVESHKEQSQMTYLGERGYQPVINYWAEQDLILADEFRDGNVPAGMDCLSSFLRATRALPQSVETIYFRSDSAAYQHKLLDKMREGVEHNGKQVPVYFAISADVSEALRGKITSLSESAWKPLRRLTEKGLIEGRKEWAELEFIPSASSVKKDMKPDRYLAIRVRPWQTELFSDGHSYHYYAVVTKRIFDSNHDVRTAQKCSGQPSDLRQRRLDNDGEALREVCRSDCLERGCAVALTPADHALRLPWVYMSSFLLTDYGQVLPIVLIFSVGYKRR